MSKEVSIKSKATTEQDVRHAQKALQTIANNFTLQELISISKKIEMPLVRLKIKSML